MRHNMRYFLDSKATWNYDLSINVPEAVLAKWATDLQKLRTAQAALGPMGNAFLNPYFPSTGTRPEIGPLPRWTATYLITQDERLREVMFANADAAASVPIHYRDEKTGQVLDVVTNPKVSVLYGTSNPALPASISMPKDTIWHPKGPGVSGGPGTGGGNVQKIGDGIIVIHAEAKIDSLEHKHRKAKLKGYRIQVFLGSYAQCRDERAKYQKSGILFPSYQVQNAPDYAVRVGDFRNIVEAMTALQYIKRNYPGPFIIPDDIQPPKLGE